MSGYQFTEGWFTKVEGDWVIAFGKQRTPIRKFVEIGSYEGRSSVWILENLLRNGGELHCIDTWQGGIEHDKSKMSEVEARFDKNVEIAALKTSGAKVFKHKGESRVKLTELLAAGHASSFDAAYVDGSHESADVLCDLVGVFQLCRVDSLIICDDYVLNFEDNLRFSPKLAIDSFVNCYNSKLTLLRRAPLSQLYIIKTRD